MTVTLMPRTLLLVAAALLTGFVMTPVLPAQADVLTYVCKAKGKSSIVKIDAAKHTFKWAGKAYRIKDAEGGDCPRFSWQVDANGKSFNFCTATQGWLTSLSMVTTSSAIKRTER